MMLHQSQLLSAYLLLLSSLLIQNVAAGLYGGRNSKVVDLNNFNFDSQVLQYPGLFLVEFYAPWCGHCQQFAPHYEKAASKLVGYAKVGAIDCDVDQNKPICGQYGIKGFPTVKLFKNKGSSAGSRLKRFAIDYNGERSAAAVAAFAHSNIQSYVKILKDNVPEESSEEGGKGKKKKLSSAPVSLEKFLSLGSNMALNHVIFFSDKKSVADLIKAISARFYRHLVVGYVESSVGKKILSTFGVEKFPTLLVIEPESSDGPTPIDSSSSSLPLGNITKYEGDMKISPLIAFLEKYATNGYNQQGSNSKSKSKKKEEEPVEEKFNPKVDQITSNDDLESYCLKETGLGVCIIGLLNLEPNYPESVSQHEKDLSLLEHLKKHAYDHKYRAFKFSWLNTAAFPSFANSFKIASDASPTLLALNPRKKLFRPFLYGYDESNGKRFLSDLMDGIGGRMFSYDWQLDLGVEQAPSPPPPVYEEDEEEEQVGVVEEVQLGDDEGKEKDEL